MKKYVLLFIIISIILLGGGCSSRKHSQRISGAKWVLHVPKEWKLYDMGDKNNQLKYIIYKRDPVLNNYNKRIYPICMITHEVVDRKIDFERFALKRQTDIITSMTMKGYKFKRLREDILKEVSTFFRINNIIALAYEFTYEDSGKKFLAINIFAKKKLYLLNLNIEATIDTYESIRKEIKLMVSSIR